jgi:Holliday junction DNA helicase RuvA
MIAALEGTISGLWLDRAVISVGGVGFLVYATPRLLGDFRLGGKVSVSIAMVVREDALTLFAFPDDDERQTFETVRSVSGIGPKIAMAMLAVHSPDELRAAIAAGDVKAIQSVPGIGPKTAQRVILELGGKLVEPTQPAASAKPTTPVDANRAQVVEALVNLGYQAKVADSAIENVLAERALETIPDAEVPEILRATLKTFGSRR